MSKDYTVKEVEFKEKRYGKRYMNLKKKVTSCFEKYRANGRVKKTCKNLKKYLKQKSDIM